MASPRTVEQKAANAAAERVRKAALAATGARFARLSSADRARVDRVARGIVSAAGPRVARHRIVEQAIEVIVEDCRQAALAEDIERYLDSLPVDDDGYRYDEADGIYYRVSSCCGASVKGSANSPTGVCCRACYEDLDISYAAAPVIAAPDSVDTAQVLVIAAKAQALRQTGRTIAEIASALAVSGQTARELLDGMPMGRVRREHAAAPPQARVTAGVRLATLDGPPMVCAACGVDKPVTKFPTMSGPLHRATTCRECRNARRAAARAT